MATEYISREAAIEKITALINKSGKYTAYEAGADDACFILEHEIPAADVVEVVHGMWEERVEQRTYAGGFLTMHYKACSICGCDPLRDENEDWALSNFCPHCGADMRRMEPNDR